MAYAQRKQENEMFKILWDLDIQTEHQITAKNQI